MPKKEWPRKVIAGNVVVKVYEMAHPTARSGKTYVLAYQEAGVRKRQKFSEATAALAEARVKADLLNSGRVEGASMTTGDRDELQAARKASGGVPLLAALAEWQKARELTGGHLIAAAEAWHGRNSARFEPIEVEKAVDAFIRAKERAGKQGKRTYKAKLGSLARQFPGRTLDSLSGLELGVYLERFDDGVTRNDHRKRAVALFRWAQKANHLPRGVPLEIEQTERANEKQTEIGIINAQTFGALLEFFRASHPEHLAAVVLAGFCGIRSDEIHGKRADREIRQIWEDVHLAEKFARVTVAKKNTPAWRHLPLCDAAIEWLMLCPNRKGPVCEAGAMEKVRRLALEAKFKIPENCFRHSFISYRIAVTNGNKPQVATEAGNSVAEIDRRYRVPVTKGEGEAWFGLKPKSATGAGEVVPMFGNGAS